MTDRRYPTQSTAGSLEANGCGDDTPPLTPYSQDALRKVLLTLVMVRRDNIHGTLNKVVGLLSASQEGRDHLRTEHRMLSMPTIYP